MPNIFDQFDAASEVKDLATSFGVGSNQLLKTVGDVYGLATGDMDNVVSRQGRENIDYLQRGKSEKLRQAEARRKAAVDAEEGVVNQALKYAKETFTDPRLLLSGTAEAVPSLVGAGGIGAGARVAAGRVLGKKGAETAAKIGVGSAVAAGSGQQGTSVGAEQYSEVADILKKMPDEQAMEVPEIARLMIENGYSLEKAKTALTLNLARSTGALAAIASAVTQMVPGGRTIESALVGGAGRKVAGGTLARRGIGAAIGGLGESLQEGAEEGSGAGLKNLLARAVEPEREITKGVGEAMGAGFSNAALLGAAAGAASRPSRPVPVGETTAGKSGEPQASDATSDIPVLESTTEQPSISLRDIENMSPEEFAAAIDVRDAASRGGKPRPEDVTSLENVRPGPVQESDTTIAPVQEALDEWRNQNPDVGLSVTVVNDPNLRNTRNYGIRGYFDPNTGEVVINSAFTKPFEVESVVNHEWSHHTLASDEGRAALAEFATRDIPATELSDLAKRYPNADNLTLVEEWIARNQEKSPGVFARIVAKIREWLNGKLGINMTNEEAARVMLRTLRERGAPIAEEGSAEMRQSTTDQPVGESEPVKREPGRSGMMASPSVVDINYDRAKRNLTSSDQARFRSDVEGFAPEATVYNAVGDWADGAENSVAAVFKDVRSSEELRQLAASAGLTGDQKAALWWRVEENGPDAIHQVTWPKGITMDEARQAMIDAGLENRTLIQTRDGVMGFVFDQGQQNLSKIDKLYESSTNPSTHSSPATGEFVGSWSTRIEGKRAYRNVLGLPTKTPEGEGVSGLGVRGRGEPETGAEAGPATGGGGVLSSPGRMDAGTGSKTSSRQPNETVRKLADEYNVQSGQDPIEHGHYVPVNESLAQRIAKAYDALPEIDRSPETIRAYETLAKEVGDQWDFAVNNLGVTFEPWTKEGQPYANSREMVKDVRDNNHLYFFQGGDPHPFLNEVDPQTGFTANDKLRAVHDLFGHAAEDYQFGPRGEENAWIKHSQMFSPEAQRALSSETRGQNSWVNFGAQNYENGVNKNIPAKDRPFAVQKTALLPEELTDWRAALGKSESEFESESEPERSSVLAKQPIRESLTDEPVEPVPEEGDPDYEEIEDTESALGAAANVRERDDLSPTSALNTLYAKKSAVPVPTTGKRTNGQVAEQLRQAAIAYWGRELSSSNLTEEDIARLVDNGVEEVLAGLKASNHAGNWYTTAIRKAMAIAGVLHPELTDDALAQKAGFKDAHAAEVGLAAAMAITSQNLNVEKNTAYANDQFNILKKTGRFDPSKVYGSKAEAISGNLELANVLLDKVGWDGMEGFLNREYTLKELNDVASQLLGQKISITGKVDDVVNGSAIFGPKIGGGFFQNLRGNFNPVTVDLWMRRTWGRWTGNVLPDPLDAKRLARMIDGMRESGIQLPEELRSIRTIIAKKGRKVPTLSDATAERVLSDPQAVTAAYDFAALHEARWNKIYGEVRQNITPEQAEAIRNGSLSLEELNRQQQKSLRQKRDAWQDLEDRPSISTKEGKAAQKELFATMDAEAGRTAILTNEELSDNKPEWAKSARVIKTLLKPIDVPSDIDRRAIVDVVNRIRNELDRQGVSATNADIQAILWYPEKDLWAKLAGKKESNLKNSYDEEFLRVAESQGLGNEARSASAKVGD